MVNKFEKLTPIYPFSLYIHIPFCTKKCDYCHFFVLPDKERFKSLYMKGLEKEWTLYRSNPSFSTLLSTQSLVSIYFGGGTPALLAPERIAAILDWITPPHGTEITLEANPENVTQELMQAYAEAGINRVSLGIQSLDDSLLKTLGRTHNAKKGIEAVFATQAAGISNISIDLMYDLPLQTLSSWEKTLKEALTLPLTHLSLYNLTIEPHTVFYKKKESLKPQLPDSELSTHLHILALSLLEEHGFSRYEISAFCKKGLVSKHNLGYWSGRPFIGLGPSAFSFWNKKRFSNVANLASYLKNLDLGKLPIDFEEQLSDEALINELFIIALRMVAGVDLLHFEQAKGPLSSQTKAVIEQLSAQDFLVKNEQHIKLTAKGMLFYDYVASELVSIN